MLLSKDSLEHSYDAVEDAYVNVGFADDTGKIHRVCVRHKVSGDGPPIVLVHGLMMSSYVWRYVFEALGRRYRVFAPDLVGAGESDKPLDLRYSVENLGRFIASYVRVISKKPVYLVGHSLGGLLSLRAVMREGESVARRLVLMHAPGYPLARAQILSSVLHAPALGSALSRLVALTAHGFPERFIARGARYARRGVMSEEECAEYGRPFETMDGARVFVKILEESLDPLEHRAIIGELRERAERGDSFPCPVKLVYATKDAIVPPSFGARYHEDIPGSELAWIEGESSAYDLGQLPCSCPEQTVREIIAFDRRNP